MHAPTHDAEPETPRAPDAERLQALLTAAPAAIIELAPDATVRTWNAAAERLFGWRPEEVLGKHVRMFYPTEDDAKAVLRAMRDGAIDSPGQVRNFQTTGRQGLYRYNNMDHSIAMGRRVAKTTIEGRDARADAVADGQEYFG